MQIFEFEKIFPISSRDREYFCLLVYFPAVIILLGEDLSLAVTT